MLNVVLYAGVLGLVFTALSVRTLLLRRRLKVAVGGGDNMILLRAARAHANFSEYVPLALILLYLLETQAGFDWMIHVFGCMLVAGRLIHALGVSQIEEKFIRRVVGMVLTLTVIVGASVRLIIFWLWAGS